MILRMPEYCSKFRCTADKCQDNCCIGWEIDIDEKSLEYYRSVEGDFGQRLRENICGEDPSCFRLGENERCRFLNDRNLCDIYTELGEDKLCHICTEHPRYYEWFDGVKEGGTGLGCEESARLIITDNRKFSYTETEIEDEDCEIYDEELFSSLEHSREIIISRLEDRSLTLEERINDVLSFAEELQYRTDNGSYDVPDMLHDPEQRNYDMLKILDFFCTLEPLAQDRIPYLRSCADMYSKVTENSSEISSLMPEFESYLEKIAVYFIWRHYMKGIFEGEFYSRVFFMALSTAVIRYLTLCCFCENGTVSVNDVIRIAKDFSKETEYSDENLSAVLDEAYNDNLIAKKSWK